MIILPDTPQYMEVEEVKTSYVKRLVTILEKDDLDARSYFVEMSMQWLLDYLEISNKDFFNFLRESLKIFEYPNLVRDKTLTQSEGTKGNYLEGVRGAIYTRDSLDGWYIYAKLKDIRIELRLNTTNDYFKEIHNGREYLRFDYCLIKFYYKDKWIRFEGCNFNDKLLKEGFWIKDDKFSNYPHFGGEKIAYKGV